MTPKYVKEGACGVGYRWSDLEKKFPFWPLPRIPLLPEGGQLQSVIVLDFAGGAPLGAIRAMPPGYALLKANISIVRCLPAALPSQQVGEYNVNHIVMPYRVRRIGGKQCTSAQTLLGIPVGEIGLSEPQWGSQVGAAF